MNTFQIDALPSRLNFRLEFDLICRRKGGCAVLKVEEVVAYAPNS